MEYVTGANVCDKQALARMGLKPKDVARLVSETFNEMIFIFGDVRASMQKQLTLGARANSCTAEASWACVPGALLCLHENQGICAWTILWVFAGPSECCISMKVTGVSCVCAGALRSTRG